MALITPAQFEHPRCAIARSADRMYERIIRSEQIVADDAAKLGAMPRGQIAHDRFEFSGPEIVGRRVDEVTRQVAG